MTLVSSSSARAGRKSVSVEVGLVADADQLGQAELPPGGPVEDGRAQRAGLGDHRDSARRRHLPGERGVHPVVGVDQAQAVGAEQAHAPRVAESAISSSSSAPSGPTSLKPAVMTTTALAPASMELTTACSTAPPGPR